MLLDLTLFAIALFGASGVPGLLMPRASDRGERIAAIMIASATLIGLLCAVVALFAGETRTAFFPWPAAGNGSTGLDALSAFFLIPVFLIGGLGAFYGLGYWPQFRHPSNGRKLRLFWGLLIAGMGLLLISRHAMSFLLGWEVMALSGLFRRH